MEGELLEPGPCACQEEVEELIRPTGFFRAKARSLRGAAAYLLEHHDGKVPRTTRELVRVPGAGRKTAAVVLAAIAGNMIQHRLVWSSEPLKLQFSKISPLAGMKRMF